MPRGHCILGGTFTYVHRGHLALFSECRKYSKVTVGLTTDGYVRRHKIYPSFPYSRRLAGLKLALAKAGLLEKASVVEIGNDMSVADRIAADAIIVSEETRGAAERINARRKRRGLAPLKVVALPIHFGQSLKKISAHDIFEGKCDPSGRQKAPLVFQAGTDNPTKLSGAEKALGRIFDGKIVLRGHKEDSQVSHHPFDEETFRGARNRARAAWARSKGKCDYSLGLESGLFALAKGVHIDITIACVYDGAHETYGTGMGFVVPEWAAARIRAHGSDLSKLMLEIMGDGEIGKKQGAVGWFSDGLMHRADQVEASVKCAFVPRIAQARKGVRY